MILFKWNKHNHKQIYNQNQNMFEKDFVDIFIGDNVANRLFGRDYIVVREFESASGIPDVLLLNRMHAERLLEFSNKYSGVRLSQAHARIILSLNKKSYRELDYIVKATGYSSSYVRSILEVLKTNEITVYKDGRWRIESSFSFPNVETISLEFKLSDWQSALKQGFRYKKLATRSYVVMPADKAQLLKKNRSRFSGLDVGALVYSHETKRTEIINKPNRSKPSNSSFLGSLSSLSDLAIHAA